MNYKEIITFLDELMIENHFYMAARTDCLYKNESQINSMQDIFKLTKSSDFTYLYAVAELLSEDYEKINKYLLDENKDSELVENIRLPTRFDKLLVATAFEENLEFFSMAWNWVVIVTSELAEKATKTSNSSITYFVIAVNKEIEELKYAASGDNEGWGKNITKIPVENLGELEILGENDTQQIIFDFFIAEEYQTKKFELTVEYEVNGEPFTAVLRNDFSEPQAVISTEPIDVDFSLGLKIKKISCKPLSERVNPFISNQNKTKLIVLGKTWEFDAMAATSGNWVDIDNGKPIIIDGYGRISIRARCRTSIVKIQFLGNTDDMGVSNLEFDIITKSDNKINHIVLDDTNKYTFKLDDVNYAKGYIIKNISYTLK